MRSTCRALLVVLGAGLLPVILGACGSSRGTPTTARSGLSPSAERPEAIAIRAMAYNVIQRSEFTITDDHPGAILFPIGTTYPEAVRALYMAMALHTDVPDTRLVNALPTGVITALTSARQLKLDLTAPFGYFPASGRPYPPSLNFPSTMTATQVRSALNTLRPNTPWPRGARVDVPILPACMTLTPGHRQIACRPQQVPHINGSVLLGPPLP